MACCEHEGYSYNDVCQFENDDWHNDDFWIFIHLPTFSIIWNLFNFDKITLNWFTKWTSKNIFSILDLIND